MRISIWLVAFLVVSALGPAFGQGGAPSPRLDQRLDSPVKVLPTPAAAGDVINMTGHLGVAPLGATIDDSDTLYVVDLFSGNTYLYDLFLVPLGSMPTPTGTNTTTGIAFAEGSLFWTDAGAGVLLETDLDGVILEVNPFLSPGAGLIGGIDYNDQNGTIWADDIIVDAYYEYSLDGVPNGVSFPSPAGTPSFGNGITHVDGSDFFDVPVGTIGEGQVTTLFRVTATTVNDQVSLLGVPDSFINGLTHHPEGTTGLPVNYIVGNATNTIFEVETFPGPNPPPPPGTEFIRGDGDGDGAVSPLVDTVFLLNFGFVPGSAAPPCLAAADVDGNDIFSALVDGVALLNFGFVPGSPPPTAPYPDCGEDAMTVAALGCDVHPCNP